MPNERPRRPLTSQQRCLIFEIIDYQAKHGFPPTIRELCGLMRISSPNGIMCHLKALKKKGCLTWQPYKPRTIALYADAICEPVRGDCSGSVVV
jgi:repressor LexA